MISTKELRIGNLIFADFNGKGDKRIVEIYQINESGCILLDEIRENINEGSLQEHWDEYLFGIELSEEWLLKFGLKCGDNLTVKGYFLRVGNAFISIDEKVYFMGQPITYIKYVHQLQNLYFALTGEELNIKAK